MDRAGQGIGKYKVELISDVLIGLELTRGLDDAFLIECSAPLKVHEIPERYRLTPATADYVNRGDWEEFIEHLETNPGIPSGQLFRKDAAAGVA
jgi:hypothetical protein